MKIQAHRALAGAGAISAAVAFAAAGTGVAAAQTTSSATHKAKTTATKKQKTTTSKAPATGKASVTSVNWGTAPATSLQAATPVSLYTLHGAGGMTVKVSQFGADIQSINVPDKQGKLVDVALGFPTLADYVADFEQGYDQVDWPIAGTAGTGDAYFGGTIGQYANRIAGGKFSLNGTNYQIDTNNGPNALHGGYLGWNTYVWSATPSTAKGQASVKMSASFPAGTGCDKTLTPTCTGFPTPIDASVTFTVTKNNKLVLSYSATNTSPNLQTVVNLTNHTYYNLGGQASGTVYNQDLAINSDTYQPTNGSQIPEAPYFLPVKGTPFDFTTGHSIGKNINATNLPDGTSGPISQLQYAHGYDFNWVLNNQGSYHLDAVAQDPKNGVTLWQYTDQPGLQVYTANYLEGDLVGTTGKAYRQGDAFTLETQHYPDSPNHIGQAGWPSVVVDPGQTFTTKTAMRFGVEPAGYAAKVKFK